MQTNAWPSVARTVFMLAVLVGLALGIRATRGIAAPILLGLVVVIGASPLVGILTKRRVPPVLAYIISLLVIVVVILAVLFLMSYMIFQTRDLLPQTPGPVDGVGTGLLWILLPAGGSTYRE